MTANSSAQIIGRAERVDFPDLKINGIPARIDTGAKTSAVWASGIIEEHGTLQCVLFGPDSPFYSGEVLRFTEYSLRTVASSIGEPEERYVVKLTMALKDRVISANFTLANRAQQVYPMLIGRNVLKGKFIVDVTQCAALTAEEQTRPKKLQASVSGREEKS